MTPGKLGNAGIIFRVSKPAIGPDLYNGYYVGINPALNRIEIGKSSEQKYVVLASSSLIVKPEKKYRLKVEAKGADIRVFLDDAQESVLNINDTEFDKGTIGFRSYDALPSYDNMKVINLAKKE